jgi:hypothetical protein
MFIIDLMFKLTIKLLCNYKRQKGVDGRMRKRKGTKWMRPKQSYYTHFNITTSNKPWKTSSSTKKIIKT